MPNTREKLIEICRRYDSTPPCDTCETPIGSCSMCGLERLIDYLIANGVTVQQWIPVTEHLPQEDQPLGALCEVVQVLLNSGRVTVGICNRGLKLWYHLPINRTSLVAHNYGNTPVVAWQPLAKAPGEASK